MEKVLRAYHGPGGAEQLIPNPHHTASEIHCSGTRKVTKPHWLSVNTMWTIGKAPVPRYVTSVNKQKEICIVAGAPAVKIRRTNGSIHGRKSLESEARPGDSRLSTNQHSFLLSAPERKLNR